MRQVVWSAAAGVALFAACGVPADSTPSADPSSSGPSRVASKSKGTKPSKASAPTGSRTTAAERRPFVTLKRGPEEKEPPVPKLPAARAQVGGEVSLTGRWAAHVRSPALLVTCSHYTDTAGVTRTYTVRTDPGQDTEYGSKPGHVWVQVAVGPDGGGQTVATATVSVSDDGTLFGGTTSTGPSPNDSKVRGVFAQSSDKRVVRFASTTVVGPTQSYTRADGIGWVQLRFSVHCPQ